MRMKVCYVDETGTDGLSPALVMVGVIADSQRLHRTRTDFADTFQRLGDVAVRDLRELKSNELYRGIGPWKGIEGSERARIISDLCGWLCDRKHDIALAAIDLEKFNDEPLHADLDEWMTGALHIALQVQRAHQRLQKRKGSTFLVFDEHQRHADRLAELLSSRPTGPTPTTTGRGTKSDSIRSSTPRSTPGRTTSASSKLPTCSPSSSAGTQSFRTMAASRHTTTRSTGLQDGWR